MRPGQTQTGMSLYQSPYISCYEFTLDWSEMNPDQWVTGCWAETRNSLTGLSLYCSHVNDNKSQTGPISHISLIFITQNISFRSEIRQQARISYRYKFILV